MTILLIILAFGTIVSSILLLKQTAKKFNLTPDQLKKIKERNELIEKEEQREKNN